MRYQKICETPLEIEAGKRCEYFLDLPRLDVASIGTIHIGASPKMWPSSLVLTPFPVDGPGALLGHRNAHEACAISHQIPCAAKAGYRLDADGETVE
jgi:hypothetical protein